MSATYRSIISHRHSTSSKTRLMTLMALRCSSCLRTESGGIGARLYHRLHPANYHHRARYVSTATFTPLSSSSNPPIRGKHGGDNEKGEYRQKGIPHFRPTSSAEVDAILSNFRSTLFLYARLPRAQRVAIAKPSFKTLREQALAELQQQEQRQAQEQALPLSPQQQLQQLAQDPSSPLVGAFYEVAGETFLLPTYTQLQTSCPVRHSLCAMLALMREPDDWDAVLPDFLREVRKAGRKLSRVVLEKTVRLANAVSFRRAMAAQAAQAARAAGAEGASAEADATNNTTTTTTTNATTDGSSVRRARAPHAVVLACAHDAARTGFVLQHVPVVRELLWGAVQRAYARAWSPHATERALAFAENVVRLLDSPLHCGRRRRRLRRREPASSASGKHAVAPPAAASPDDSEAGMEGSGLAETELEEASEAAQNERDESAAAASEASEASEVPESQEGILSDDGDADDLPADPRVQPDVIGPLLLLAAVRDSKHGGGRDADGAVRMYAERLRANWVHAQTDALQRAASWDERGADAAPSSTSTLSSSLFSAFSSSSSSPSSSSSSSSPPPSAAPLQHDPQHMARRRAFWDANSELVRWMPVLKGMDLALDILTEAQTTTTTGTALEGAGGNGDAAAADADKERRKALTAWLRATTPALREALDSARTVVETLDSSSRPAGPSYNADDDDGQDDGSSSSNSSNGRRKGLVAYDMLASL